MSTAVATEFPTRMYIDGAWCEAKGGKTLAVINPADESVLADVAYGDREDAELAIKAAARAFPDWRAASVYDRAKILKKTAELMRDRADRIAGALTQEQGKPFAEARMEVLHAADTFEWFAEEGKRSTAGSFLPRMSPSDIMSSSTRWAWLARSHPGTSRPRFPVARSRLPWPPAARS